MPAALADAELCADPFAQLNERQRAAVAHGRAPLLVVAGPGSGKTRMLAARAARLVLDGADPQRLLMLTFSRRAAREMSQRTGQVLRTCLGLGDGAQAPCLPWAGTFHAIAARLLRDWAPALGLSPSFTLLDRADAEDLLALERQALGLAAQRIRFPLKSTCLAIYSRVLNSDAPLDEVLQSQFPWCAAVAPELKALFAAYAAAKRRQQLLDYDDLLVCWAEAMAEPALAAALGARFEHVLVDEYQDTNRLQAQILRRLKPDGQGLTVVGDDAQSIYAFRAAELRNMLDFPDWYAPPAQVIALEQNYRSTPALLAASNALMAQAEQRLAKTMWSAEPPGPRAQIVTVADDAAQAVWVTDEVLRQRENGLALRRQAVLFRTAQHSAALELELARRRVPFVKYGGLKFMESGHVKDLLSLLRWAQNPCHALAGFRCALLVPGIGPASARRLLGEMDAASDPVGALRAFRPPAAAAGDWAGFGTLWCALVAGSMGWPATFDAALAWYLPQLRRLHEDPASRVADLRQLQQIARGYPSRERFLAELTLDPPQASSDEAGAPLRDEDYLILSTIHSAKGQEWSAVHVLNVVDGCLPADLSTGTAAEVAEERRLLYVAMTRARRHLHLLMPQRFYVTQQARGGDRHLYASASRFLTPEVAACCEVVSAAVESSVPPIPGPGISVDITGRLGARWA